MPEDHVLAWVAYCHDASAGKVDPRVGLARCLVGEVDCERRG